MHKLIFIDIDGTLRTSDGKISDRVKNVIGKLTQKGIHIVLASGRCDAEVEIISKECGASKYILSSTGALITDYVKNKIIHSTPLSPLHCQKIFEIANKYNLRFIMNIGNDKIVNRYKKAYAEHDKDEILLTTGAAEYLKNTNLRASQCVIQEEPGKSSENVLKARKEVLDIDGVSISNQSHELFDPTCIIKCSHFIDIVKNGVSKGTAIEALASYLGVPLSQTMAIGDSRNDIDMFNVVGYSVAMGNAIDELKAIASKVTLSNEDDGVAVVLEEVLKNLETKTIQGRLGEATVI